METLKTVAKLVGMEGFIQESSVDVAHNYGGPNGGGLDFIVSGGGGGKKERTSNYSAAAAVKDWDNTTIRKWLSKRKNGAFATCLRKLDPDLNGRTLMKMSAEKLAGPNALCDGNITLATQLFRSLREENERAKDLQSQMRGQRRKMIRGFDAT